MSQPLPRYTAQPIQHDPIEIMLAARQAREDAALQALAEGRAVDADPTDLRGIPCIARGVGGTSPGTNPLTATLRALSIRRPSLHSDRP